MIWFITFFIWFSNTHFLSLSMVTSLGYSSSLRMSNTLKVFTFAVAFKSSSQTFEGCIFPFLSGLCFNIPCSVRSFLITLYVDKIKSIYHLLYLTLVHFHSLSLPLWYCIDTLIVYLWIEYKFHKGREFIVLPILSPDPRRNPST